MRLFAHFAFLVSLAGAQTHRALVISNLLFDGKEIPGARECGAAAHKRLATLGYHVTTLENTSDFRRVFESFAPSTPTGGTVVVYFTGYGNRFSKKVVKKSKLPDGSETREESFHPASGIWPSRPRSEPWPLDQVVGFFKEHSRAHTHHFVFECPEPCPKKARGHQDGLTFPTEVEFLNCHFHSSLPDLAKVGAQPATGKTLPTNPKPGDEWMNGAGMTFCYCPPGRFKMGRRSEPTPRNGDAKPVEVNLTRGFWISKYEVTSGDYFRLRKRTPSTRGMLHSHGHLPLTMIKGPGAKDFGKKTLEPFEKKAGTLPSGWEYRLPTEAEWEYAARAGSALRYPFGDDPSALGKFANFAEAALYRDDDTCHWADRANDDSVGSRLAPVGSYQPNAWGIHDMLGNATEFVADHYQSELPGGEDPRVILPKGSTIVLRGGAWCSTAENCDPSFRLSTRLSNNDGHANWRGLRVILAPKS